jgi:hypothetical protein
MDGHGLYEAHVSASAAEVLAAEEGQNMRNQVCSL